MGEVSVNRPWICRATIFWRAIYAGSGQAAGKTHCRGCLSYGFLTPACRHAGRPFAGCTLAYNLAKQPRKHGTN